MVVEWLHRFSRDPENFFGVLNVLENLDDCVDVKVGVLYHQLQFSMPSFRTVIGA